jgi:hypothetical protein
MQHPPLGSGCRYIPTEVIPQRGSKAYREWEKKAKVKTKEDAKKRKEEDKQKKKDAKVAARRGPVAASAASAASGTLAFEEERFDAPIPTTPQKTLDEVGRAVGR